MRPAPLAQVLTTDALLLACVGCTAALGGQGRQPQLYRRGQAPHRRPTVPCSERHTFFRRFVLSGVVEHSGTLNGGHYVAYIRRAAGGDVRRAGTDRLSSSGGLGLLAKRGCNLFKL